MNANKSIRVIQIGAGRFGQSWMNIVKSTNGAELAAITDISEVNLKTAGEAAGLSPEYCFKHPEDAFRHVEADMALIVTPPPTHKEIAIQALRAGLHVLLEKPLAHTYEEALELLKASRKTDRMVAVSQNYRLRAPLQTVKKLLNEQRIGRIGYVEYEFRKAVKFGGWRDEYNEILLEDMSIHHFDIVRFLLEKEAEEITARSFRPEWSWFRGNPSANVFARFEGGIPLSYFGSWVSRGKETTWNGDVRIVGDQGAIEMKDDQVHLWTEGKTGEAVEREIELLTMPFDDRTTSLDQFIHSLKTGQKPATSIEDNIRSFELTCAAVESAQSGKTVSIGEFSRLHTS